MPNNLSLDLRLTTAPLDVEPKDLSLDPTRTGAMTLDPTRIDALTLDLRSSNAVLTTRSTQLVLDYG